MSSRDLRLFLAYFNFTQTAFSKMVGVTRATVSLWCNGKVPVPERVVEFCKEYVAPVESVDIIVKVEE